jgi:HEPN domain-containing protein
LPRKTDSHNPADWLHIAASDFELVGLAAEREVSFGATRSKRAEVLEKILKAELLRLGWTLERTHDLNRLLQSLVERNSDLAPTAEPLCDVLVQVYFTDR